MSERVITVTVNGCARQLRARGCVSLLTVLREELGLIAAKEGCGQGDCGTCVVALNGRPVNACLVMAHEVEGAEITTLEGLASKQELHPLQRIFAEKWAFQCGYCTPGMLMSSWALLQRNPAPTRGEVEEAIEGNLCRCTSYRNIVEAVLAAAEEINAERGA